MDRVGSIGKPFHGVVSSVGHRHGGAIEPLHPSPRLSIAALRMEQSTQWTTRRPVRETLPAVGVSAPQRIAHARIGDESAGTWYRRAPYAEERPVPTARDVANHFLLIAAADEDGECLTHLTHLKLQKLLYYAQGFHLAIFGRRLFPETIEAWEHGPVAPAAWSLFRRHGGTPIPAPADSDQVSLSAEQRDLLNDEWNTYGQFSARKLRNMTHEEAPWKEAFRAGGNAPITDEALVRYFRTQVTDDETA